ncbi:hypothetical protein BDZ94DRAFT_1313101 [Collybia nuda]|uniref:Uncharacterized protein n=1 Tax=Collybia nuda TaxID=64659 RepID=A0A9P6CF44_9AGAR|nr:hypothetical protein BDZ94DRAFT_1313101 [Collybia nuda]
MSKDTPTAEKLAITDAWLIKLDKAAGNISLMVEEDQTVYFNRIIDNPVAMWKALQTTHMQKRPRAHFNTYDDLFSIRKQEEESLQSLINRVEQSVTQIKNLHPEGFTLVELDSELASMALIRALPEDKVMTRSKTYQATPPVTVVPAKVQPKSKSTRSTKLIEEEQSEEEEEEEKPKPKGRGKRPGKVVVAERGKGKGKARGGVKISGKSVDEEGPSVPGEKKGKSKKTSVQRLAEDIESEEAEQILEVLGISVAPPRRLPAVSVNPQPISAPLVSGHVCRVTSVSVAVPPKLPLYDLGSSSASVFVSLPKLSSKDFTGASVLDSLSIGAGCKGIARTIHI